MGAGAWLTLVVLAAVVAASFHERSDPAFVLGAGVGVLLVAGVLSPARALAGFANPAVAVIGLLFVLVGSLERTAWLPWLAGVLFGDREARLGLRGLAPVALLSAFMANVTVVAVLMPAVREWARRHRVAVSRLMMPLGVAATLGGLLTLVGTSSNLVVNGLLMERGDPGLGFFEIGVVGLPIAIAGLVYLTVAAPRLLPERHDPLGELDANPREYVGWLRVVRGGPLEGARIGELRHLDDLFVAGVERDGVVRSPVGPRETLRGGDVLAFVGRVDRIAGLATDGGLEPVDAGGGRLDARGGIELVEAVVSPSSPIVGRNIREAGFRGRYDAVVLAVHRHGERLHGKIGDIVVEPGDTLLIAAGAGFLARWRFARDFYLVSSLGALPAAVSGRDWTEPLVLGGVIAAVALGLAPLLPAVVVGVLALVLTGRLRPADVWTTVHWPALVMIAASIAMSHALEDSGLAGAVVHGVLGGPAAGLGRAGLIALILVVTAALTEVLDNPAAAALVFPVAAVVAAGHGVGLHAVAVAVAVGASSAFLTPFGYHVNVMIAGAGSYRTGDFVRLGLPLKLLVLAIAAAVIPLAW
ncbi:MAG TPA: SLC13 family permease [Acidobacteria bacterium]|nr:SLC13 family permease [Acidobacteriota bacterium]